MVFSFYSVAVIRKVYGITKQGSGSTLFYLACYMEFFRVAGKCFAKARLV